MTSVLTPIACTQQSDILNNKPTTVVSWSQLFNSWFPITNEQSVLYSTLFDKFYYAVRLIDDVQDGTLNRKGEPTANVLLGVPLAINAGMLATVKLIDHVLQFKNDKATQVFLEEFKLMWEGQGEQLQWTKCPSLEEVVKMSEKKGVMVSLFGRILCALSGRDDTPYKNMFTKFNVLLQLENDISGTADLKDITEGQYNFLTAYAIEQEKILKSSNRLEQILLSKTTDAKLLHEARDILIETGTFEFSIEFKNRILSEIINETKSIGGNKFCEDVLNIYGTKPLEDWQNNSTVKLEDWEKSFNCKIRRLGKSFKSKIRRLGKSSKGKIRRLGKSFKGKITRLAKSFNRQTKKYTINNPFIVTTLIKNKIYIYIYI